MHRRKFVLQSSLLAFSVSAFGKVKWDGTMYVGDSPTTTDILGPFYRPGAPMRTNLIPPGSAGVVMHLDGTIYKDDGITPLPDALVEIWHCDDQQQYDNTSDAYLCRGAVRCGKNGKYHFTTIVPVPYKANESNEDSWRPAHIHMRVSSPAQQDLITQIYFEGDKYNSKDPSSSAPQAANRILKMNTNGKGERTVKFDVVMAKNFPLEDAVYEKITGLYNMGGDSVIAFERSDDLLFLKRNGQLMASLRYIGNNTFEGGMGMPKVAFELMGGGKVKATITLGEKVKSGEKFLKYKT